MYDFLLSEAWWIETIINISLSTAAILLAGWIMYKGKFNNILKAVQKDSHEENLELPMWQNELPERCNRLSPEYESFSVECDKLIKHQDRLQMQFSDELATTARAVDKMSDKVDVIYNIVEIERAKQDARYNTLSDKDKQLQDFMRDGIGAIKKLQDSIQGLTLKHNDLLAKYNALLATQGRNQPTDYDGHDR